VSAQEAGWISGVFHMRRGVERPA